MRARDPTAANDAAAALSTASIVFLRAIPLIAVDLHRSPNRSSDARGPEKRGSSAIIAAKIEIHNAAVPIRVVEARLRAERVVPASWITSWAEVVHHDDDGVPGVLDVVAAGVFLDGQTPACAAHCAFAFARTDAIQILRHSSGVSGLQAQSAPM